MQQITYIRKLTCFLLFACIVQACHSATAGAASTGPLMCYVCQNCAKITEQTPVEACDAEYFDNASTTKPDVTTIETTTMNEPTTTTNAPTTTTNAPTTTTMNEQTTTATMNNTELPTTTGAPTAPTVGPLVTIPTPPNVDADIIKSASSTVSFGKPEALAQVAEEYTYHCYSVKKTVAGSAQMERGCARVTPKESVCNHLDVLNNGTKLSDCVPCSNNSCNGSSALGVSVAALLFTLIAALLSRQ